MVTNSYQVNSDDSFPEIIVTLNQLFKCQRVTQAKCHLGKDL